MTDLRPVLHDDGTPVMSSGNFAVVFKMKDERDGKLYAVKCFTREQEERAENYRMIAEELGKVSSPYITPVKWLDGELFVDTTQTDETEFPVLLMDWIEGPTLSAFLQSIADQLKAGKVFKDNEYEMFELRCLPANYLRMASWLLKQPFAHGDLKPDNIIVQEDGYCVLVDYDGMYVPAMQGMPQTCMGTPNFMHPSQAAHTLYKDIDSYAIAVIALSLQTFALRPNLIGQSPDFCVITKQQALKLYTVSLLDDEDLMADNNIQELLSLFLHTLSQNKLDAEYFDKAIAEILVPKDFDIYNTEVTDEDLENCYEDRFNIRYSLDGRRLLGNRNFHTGSSYRIREGVLSVCSRALQPENTPSDELKRIFLPDSVQSIGGVAFANNDDLTICNIPQSVIYIDDNNPWGGCFNIKQMSCNSKHFIIEDGILYSADHRIVYGLIYFHSDIIIDKRAKIISSNAFWSNRPNCELIIKTVNFNNIEEIGDKAFLSCKSIETVNLSEVKKIGEWAFSDCTSLRFIMLSSQLSTIKKMTFWDCSSLQHIVIPNSATTIEKGAFGFCESLLDITIPDSVTTIGDGAFLHCVSLQNITIPDSVTSIGRSAFNNCKRLTNIEVSVNNSHYSSLDGVLFNKDRTILLSFPQGKRKKSYEIPSSVTIVGYCAFAGCVSLQSITIPSSVTTIEEDAFANCKSFQNITIPNSVTTIEEDAFACCKSLQDITIPDSTKRIGEFAFAGCESLKSITILNPSTNIGNNTFRWCNSINKIYVPHNCIDQFKTILPDYRQIIAPIS